MRHNATRATGRWPEPDQELDRLASEVVDSALEVHRCLGPGFNESVDQEALSVVLHLRQIPFAAQVPVVVEFKGWRVGEGRLDLLVGERLVVELKAVEALAPIHWVQVRSYLKATRRTLALLINFNVPLLRDGIKRIIQPA